MPCSSVWDNCNKGLKNKLQKLQNRAETVGLSRAETVETVGLANIRGSMEN